MRRRTLLASSLAVPFLSTRARAEEVVVRMGVLKLIHSITPYFYEKFVPAGYRVEVIPFEAPNDCKNAVVTKSIDFGTFGVAASILSAVAHEPLVVIGSACNKGMAIVAAKGSDIATLKDLRGKRVAIWPGSTQEVFVLERLRMEGMSVHDITPVRVSFSEMHAALARGDVDAYVGAEPAPGVSISTGVGKIVEYPYSTAMGSLNMILATHREIVDTKPDLCRMMVNIQRQASAYAMGNPQAMVDMTVAKLGQKREAIAVSVPNVELNWRMTPEMLAECDSYAQQMLALKQIKAVPDMKALFDPRFSDDVAREA
jgi:ABC-type nitrate/sulfonate/bicarbonate transport system substrate-binding protein